MLGFLRYGYLSTALLTACSGGELIEQATPEAGAAAPTDAIAEAGAEAEAGDAAPLPLDSGPNRVDAGRSTDASERIDSGRDAAAIADGAVFPDAIAHGDAVVSPDAALPDALVNDAAQPLGCEDGSERACPAAICPGGLQRCVGGQFGACVGPGEVCDSIDNDCDGEVDEGQVCGPVVCWRLVDELEVYFTADRANFFAATRPAYEGFEWRADGAIPEAGDALPWGEYVERGFEVFAESDDPTAALVYSGSPEAGFAARLSCAVVVRCEGDIVVLFTAPVAAVGFDYPGNVRGLWYQPTGEVIFDTGDLDGGGDNFVGIRSPVPIGSMRLIREASNQLGGVALLPCN